MIYDIRRVRIDTEHGWTWELQIKRNASSDWERVRLEFEVRTNGVPTKEALPMTDEVRSLS